MLTLRITIHTFTRRRADLSLDRKVRCDGQRPKCDNCTKGRRICQGYGIQLSWPREGDKRRAIVLRDAHRAVHDLPFHVKTFLNTSSWDTSLSDELEKGRRPGKNQSRTHYQAYR